MSKTKTYPAKDEVPQMVDKSAAMKSYERARADVEAGRVVECKDKVDFFAKLGL